MLSNACGMMPRFKELKNNPHFSISGLLLTIGFFMIFGCASSDPKLTDSYPNLTELQQPEDTPHQEGKVYIDSLKQITIEKENALLISGKLADGCTHLRTVSHQETKDNSLHLQVTAWRHTDKMCTQALVPFSYIYQELSNSQIIHYSDILINGKKYSI
ncbi:hypothetical protein [Fodinibius salicampi]|nr:hypothetical protein [Fodinibius salicampi]